MGRRKETDNKKQTSEAMIKWLDERNKISNLDIAILRSLANGDDTAKTSIVVNRAYATVETLKGRLYKKIKVRNAAHAVAWGFKNKLIEI